MQNIRNAISDSSYQFGWPQLLGNAISDSSYQFGWPQLLGPEATNSMLKRVTGLDRLRVRGRPAVFSSILLKVAGWNLLRAASVRSLINKLTKGGVSGQSALAFAASYRRPEASSSVLVA